MAAAGDVLRGKYRLLRGIGEGGMGQVFEAEHLHTGAHVAIKLLHADMLDHGTARRRFLREARASARVGHRNIVEVYDLDMDDSGAVPFIVQELLTGRTLAAALAALPEGRMSPHAALTTLVPLMGALVGAHRRGVVHRDLKPANIFLCEGADGAVTPKLIDFGIAKELAAGEATSLTATGAVLGSPEYMSPEQVAGDTTVDAQTDVWAMGVVLYEALTGRPPFHGDSPTGTMVKVLHAPVPPITSWGVELGADLAAAVHRALERDRSARHATMQRFVEALLETRAWRSEATLVEFDTTERDLPPPSEREADPDAPTLVRDDAPRVSRPQRTPPRAMPWWAVVLGAVLLAAVAALIGRAIGRAGS